MNAFILKLDFKMAYDSVSWQFLHLLFDQIGLDWNVTKWIMGCITSVNTAVLVNGTPTYFFKCHKGLRHGCMLSPLIFLLVIEALNKMMIQAVEAGTFQGLKVVVSTFISHLLFFDDVLIMSSGKFEH